MNNEILLEDLKRMDCRALYNHLVTALNTAMTTEKNSPAYNQAAAVIKAHYSLYKDNVSKRGKKA